MPSYAEALAERKERENRLAEKLNGKGVEDRPESLPGDVPSKVTITIKQSGRGESPDIA